MGFGKIIGEAMGTTWAAIDTNWDAIAAGGDNVWYSPRGSEGGPNTYIFSVEVLSWCAKLNLALHCGESAVSKQQMQAELPTPQQMASWVPPGSESGATKRRCCPNVLGFSPYLLA